MHDDSKLKEELRALVAEISEVDTIPDEATFKDLGIDSMMGVEIVAAVERQYQIKIDDSRACGVSDARQSVRAGREEARREAARRRRLSTEYTSGPPEAERSHA